MGVFPLRNSTKPSKPRSTHPALRSFSKWLPPNKQNISVRLAAKQHSFFENGTPPLFGWSHMVPRCPKAFKVLHHLFVEQLPLTCSFRSAPGLCNLCRILWDCLIMPVVQLQCVTKQDTYSILSQAFPSCKGVYAYRDPTVLILIICCQPVSLGKQRLEKLQAVLAHHSWDFSHELPSWEAFIPPIFSIPDQNPGTLDVHPKIDEI